MVAYRNFSTYIPARDRVLAVVETPAGLSTNCAFSIILSKTYTYPKSGILQAAIIPHRPDHC